MKFSITDFIEKLAYHIEGVDQPTLAMVEEYLNLHGKRHTFEELLNLPNLFNYIKETKADPQAYELSIWAAIGQYISDNNLIPNFTIYADADQIDDTYDIHLIDVYWNCYTGEEYAKRSLDKYSLEYLADSVELKLSVWAENRWVTIDRYPTKKEIAVQLLKVLDKFNEVDFK